MNEQLSKQKFLSRSDEKLITEISSQLLNLLSSYEVEQIDEFVFEHSNDVFKRICKKAKDSVKDASKNMDKEKLCYLAAVYLLKSGLFYVLEKAYKNGYDFEDL